MTADITVERLTSSPERLEALAALRMEVFRGWPYLYEGDRAYEEQYLRDFLGDDRATLVLARVGEVPVGMATASPMVGQSKAITAPVAAAGIDPAAAFYFGESVLLAPYQGLGIGHRFFDEREAAAREAGASHALFCAVVRAADHPARPGNARDLGPFWRARGYTPLDGAVCSFDWREIGAVTETAHPMQFWIRTL